MKKMFYIFELFCVVLMSLTILQESGKQGLVQTTTQPTTTQSPLLIIDGEYGPLR